MRQYTDQHTECEEKLRRLKADPRCTMSRTEIVLPKRDSWMTPPSGRDDAQLTECGEEEDRNRLLV